MDEKVLSKGIQEALQELYYLKAFVKSTDQTLEFDVFKSAIQDDW